MGHPVRDMAVIYVRWGSELTTTCSRSARSVSLVWSAAAVAAAALAARLSCRVAESWSWSWSISARSSSRSTAWLSARRALALRSP